MFEGFEARSDPQARKRIVLSTGASVAIYVAAGVAVLLFAGKASTAVESKEIDISFRPPPPPPQAAPPSPAPAPIVPKTVKVKRVAAPAPRPVVVPKAIPDEKPPEADPKDAVVEVGEGSGEGDPLGVPGGTGPAREAPPPPPPPPKPKARVPINLPEDATPPVADPGNASPEYPVEAREKGLESQVILKIVVSEKGTVTKIDVLRGDEPFVSKTLAAVRTWRYSPAIVGGEPTAVFRIVKVPFRLK